MRCLFRALQTCTACAIWPPQQLSCDLLHTLLPALAICAVACHTALWHKLLNDIPDDLLSSEQKSEAKAAIAFHKRTAEERLGVFCGGHASAAQRIRRLISLRGMLPGVKLTRGQGRG